MLIKFKFIVIAFTMFIVFHSGSKLNKQIEMNECPKYFDCIHTYTSEDSFTDYHIPNWNQKIIFHEGPRPLEKILVLINKEGNLFKVELEKNVIYIKAIWNGKDILVSQRNLDFAKKLRILEHNLAYLQKEPFESSPIITIIPKNTVIRIIENTEPISKKAGYIRTRYNDLEGWIKRNSLSDDPYDIRFYNKSIQEIILPFHFNAKEEDYGISLKIQGEIFKVTECSVSGVLCSSNVQIGTASFGKKQDALQFHLTTMNEKKYTCEIRREDFLYEWERFEKGSITKGEISPFLNCSQDGIDKFESYKN